MRRATSKRVLLQKNRDKIKRRPITPTVRPVGLSSLYEEIKRRNGRAHVCVIRSVGGIGDVLMTTPVMLQLKREFSDLRLTYAVDRHRTTGDSYYHLIKNAWFIDDVIDARYVNRVNYDAVVDLSSVCIRYERRGLPPVNRVDLFARACGVVRLRKKIPFYRVERDEEQWAQIQLSPWRKLGKKIVSLHTASFEGKRSWTPANYIELIKHTQLHRPDIQFAVMDFNSVLGDISRFENCYNVSHTKIREKAALISESNLFIGPDSGPMHLAGAVSTPSLVIFGSVPPDARINYYPTHEPITHNALSCLGCWYEACPIQVRCMTGLSHHVVYNRMVSKLGV